MTCAPDMVLHYDYFKDKFYSLQCMKDEIYCHICKVYTMQVVLVYLVKDRGGGAFIRSVPDL